MSTAKAIIQQGNRASRAFGEILFTAAEILTRLDYLGAPILGQAWCGAGTTLNLVLTTTDAEDNLLNSHDSTHTSVLNQPMWSFLIDAIATFAAAMDDVRVTASQAAQQDYRVDVLPIGVDGSSLQDVKAENINLTEFTFVLAPVE